MNPVPYHPLREIFLSGFTSFSEVRSKRVWRHILQVSNSEQAECQLNFVYVFKRKTEWLSCVLYAECKFRREAPTQAESYTVGKMSH